MGKRWVEFWLRVFFWWTRYAPWGPRLTRAFWVNASWLASSYIRDVTASNAGHILGPDSSESQRLALGKKIHGSFFDFVCEMGNAQGQSREQLLARIDEVAGSESYLKAREAKKGAVLVTAHLGNFEVGLAEMTRIEPRVHVVFQRDRVGKFENIRAEVRRRLGVIETPIDDGMASWMVLKEAMESDAVVMLQGDRAMPGQKARDVPFFDGHLSIPIGPAKLAMMTGAPLIPVFALRTTRGRVRILLDEPIMVPDMPAVASATDAVGRSIERVVRDHPTQWHVLHKAWVQDAPPAPTPQAEG